MAETTTTYGPKDKQPKWQVKPFNFSAVKKIGQDNKTARTEQKVLRKEVRREDPIVNDPVPVTEEPKLGMGDLKQAEADSNVNFFDQKPPRNINDLYQVPQDNTRAPVYDYKRLEDKPIAKKVYKERINNPENREPTFPISQPVETESGSYEAKDLDPELQAQEIIQKTEILNKINSGEINLPPFVSSLPVDMQLSYVGATYNNNPLYTSLSTLMEPLLHLDNLVRSGMNKAFDTDYKMLTPPNMSGEDEEDKLITGGTELLTALIPLGASIKGANYLLQGIKNPFIKKILGTGLGFVINSQPALLDNLQQGNMELKDYAIQSATDFATGLTFGAMPHGTPLKYDLPYQTIVPTMVPVISDLIQGKEINEKELVSGFLSNMVLGLVMSGQLSKDTPVKEFTRKVETELNKYDESQKTPETVNKIIAGLLPPAREQNTETISRVKTGEKPTIEQVTVPGDRSRIVVDEQGTAKVEPEAEQQGYIAPIKLTAEQYDTMKNSGMTDAEIKEAQDNLNSKVKVSQRLPAIYNDVFEVDTDGNIVLKKGKTVTDIPVPKVRMSPDEIKAAQDNIDNTKPIYKEKEFVRVEDGQDNRITPEAKPEPEPVKQEPEREYETVTLEREDFGKKFVVDSKGNKFIVKAEKDDRGIEFYNIYRKGPADPAPVKLGKYLGRAGVNIGLRAHAEGDMKLVDRPKLKQEAPEVKKEEVSDQEKKYTKAYDDMLDLRDEVNNVKSSDLSGRANKSKNIALLKKAVDIYNGNHPDNNAKIERTKYGNYNITINGKPLRRESVKREFDPETEANNIDNPNATKSFKELGAEEREVQRKIAENIIETGPALVKEKAKFDTPVKVLRKGLEDIKEDSGKEQSAEAKIVREEMLEKTDNGAEYRVKIEDGQDNGTKEKEIDAKDRPTLHMGDMEGMDEGAKKYKAFRTKDGEGIILKKNEDGEVYAVNKDGEVVGFATKLSDTETDLTVAKEYQQKGIGTEILSEFKKLNPEHGTGGLTPLGKKTLESVNRKNGTTKKKVKTDDLLTERKNIFEKMTLPQIEKHIENRVKEFKSRVDYLQSAEYKEIIKPLHQKLLNREATAVKKEVEYEKEKLKNKVITKEQYDKAIRSIKERGKNMYSNPIDPAALKDLTVVGLYHFEKGMVKFGDWAKRMVKELGDKIKPHLKKIWAEINKDRTGLKNVVTQGYAGRQALGYEKAKEEGRVFKNPYDKKERFEIDDSKAKMINKFKESVKHLTKYNDEAGQLAKDWGNTDRHNPSVFDQEIKRKLEYVDNPDIRKRLYELRDIIYKGEPKRKKYLKDILSHPELYRNYPESKHIEIEYAPLTRAFSEGKTSGRYDSKNNKITLDTGMSEAEIKSTLLHEIQHAIQEREGFAKGGNIAMFKDVNTKDKLLTELKNVASKLFDKLPEDLKNDARKVNREEDLDGISMQNIQNNPEAKAIWADYLNARKQINEIDNTPNSEFSIETAYDQYRKLAGEIESRDVQARMNLTKEQRDPNSPEYVAPYSSENISPEDAIVRYDGTESMSSMKLKEKDGQPENFEQYKKRIAKEYGTIPTREEYNDAKQLKITGEKVQEKNDVKTELEGVLNDVVNAPAKQKTLDELRSRTSKGKKNAPANEVYMDKVYTKMSEIQADMEKRGYKGQSLMNQSEIQSIKHLFSNDPEFKKFKADQKRAIVREVKNYYKEEYRKRTAANAVLGEEYADKNWWNRIKNSSFLQSRNHIARQGPSGKEMAERFKHMTDQERELMGEPSGLLLDIEGLTKAEKNNLEKIWEQKMNEQIPMNYLNDNVKNLDAKIDDYFENMANMYKDRGFVTRNLLTGDVYAFTPKRDYRPRILNDKVSELEVKEDSSGIPKENKSREKVIDFLIETKQAKDRAGAAILLDNELSKHRIRKAGNVEYSRNEKLRLPDEYYVKNPTESLLAYAKKVSKRVAFVDAWGMEGQIFNRLRDDLYKEGKDYIRANDLFRYETGQLTAKERQAIYDVNNVKAFMALTKFSPFTSLRNAFQGFLGTTTRGNLKAGFSGLVKSLDPVMKKHAYEAGVMADNLEGIFKDTIGANSNNFLGNLTTKYLDLIKFTATDRYNRVISAVGGLSFMEDMLKRIQKDSVWKKRAAREFKKLQIDPDKVIENGGFTKAEKDKIMRTFAFDSQFSLRPQDLPLWWSSPMGKLVTQWKPWGYKMTQLIRDNVIAEVKHGNVMPLVTMLTAYGVTGEAVNYLIDNIRSVANFNPKEDDNKNETPNEKSLIGKINQGDIGGVFERAVNDLAGLGALSLYWDIIRSFGYGKYGQGISVLAGPAYGEGGSIIENVLGPTLKKLAFKSNDDWEEVTKKTIKGLYKSTTGNVPGAGTFRTFGMTKAFEDYLFKNDGPEFKDDSIIGEYYKGLDDPGKEEVKKIKEMEKDLKAFREQVLSNPTKEMQREFQKKESEIKKYKDKSRVWYNYTKLKSTKEKEESKKLGK